ncbi:MAG: glutamate racemase [Alphaproteobacteria bacterium]|nr:glutamate racemase [Alphaproteobacteria bacterium]
MSHRILIFDSGLGGLSVARAVMHRMPGAQAIYAADNDGFPYGDWPQDKLVERIVEVLGRLISLTVPSVVVIACNTASTLALEALRQRFELPFVGTVPAIKPAAEASKSGIIGVLATPGTVDRAYTQALVDTFASHRTVVLHGCKNLAEMAEHCLRGLPVDDEALAAEIAPVFVQQGERQTDAVVLGCTHYPLIADRIAEVSPWRVDLIDPSDAIARQVARVADSGGAVPQGSADPPTAVLTKSSRDFVRVLAQEGFRRNDLIVL